ncbi:MAG: ABC transporter substrate-binding protein [Chloroflexota bacterium]
MHHRINRRGVLRALLAISGAGLLTACGSQAPAAAPTSGPPPTPKPISPQAPAASPAASPGASPAASPAAAAPAQKPAAAAEPVRGGSLTLLRTAEHRGFNPAHLDAGGIPLHRALYNTLLRYDDTLNVVPELAEKYDLAADGKSIKLELRKGVKFHSGRDLTADDVDFSVKFFQDEKNGAPIRGQALLIKQVEKPDQSTVILRFDQPNTSVFDVLDAMFIVDQSMADKIPQTDAGSGPFKVADFRPGELSRMTPFEGYWERGKPYLGEYIVKPAPDAQQMVVQLETGRADVVWIPSYQDLERLSKDSKFQVGGGAPGGVFWDIAVNTTSPDLTDKRVRQAISYVLDRERYARTAMRGFAEPTSLPFPKTSWAYFPDLEGKHKRDVEKAKQLMAEAGKANGFEVKILASSKRTPGQNELAQMLQANLEEIKIRSKIEDVEVAVYETRSRISDWDLMVHSYGRANKDPQSLFTGAIAWYPKGSWTKFDNAEYTKLVADAGSIVDREQRKPIYRKLVELALDQCFTIPVCEAPRPFVLSSKVKNLRVTLDNVPFAGDAWVEK